MVTYRIGFSDLNVYESSGESWKKSSREFPLAIDVSRLFKANKSLGKIRDLKDRRFLVGECSNGKVCGGRIKFLPNGEELDKAFSLFSPGLKIHDEKSKSHWDVMFENPNGSYAYVYSIKKDDLARKKKYGEVKHFEKLIPLIERKVDEDIETGDVLAVAMKTLLKTFMRVGNEIYYLHDGHKGLTTLQKKDVGILGNKVTFNFIGKDGVPQTITERFSKKYVSQLLKILEGKKKEDFIFCDSRNRPLKDTAFEKRFEDYCGTKFYPHIVRSYFATKTAEDFMKKKSNFDEGEVRKMYNLIAEKLGHKKFSKKDGEWKSSYQVTLKHYIDPIVVDKISKHIKK